MRLSIKTKQVAGVVLIVGLAVVILSAIHLAWITRIHLRESLSRGEMVAQFVFERASGVVTTREQAYSALQGDPGLRSLLLSSIAYSEHVTSAAIVDPRNVAIVHSSPTLEGQVLEPQPLLKALLDQGPLDQFQAITGDRTFEVQQPLLMRREAAPTTQAADAGPAGGAGAAGGAAGGSGGTAGAGASGAAAAAAGSAGADAGGAGGGGQGGTEQFGSIRVGVSTTLIRRDLRQALWNSATTAFISLIVATGIALLLAQWTLRPVHVLKSGLSRLGRGEFDVKLDLPPGDEFGELGDSFNLLSAELSAVRSQLAAGQAAPFESVVDRLEDAVAMFNPEGQLLFANAAMRGALPESSSGASLHEALAPAHPYRALVEQALQSRRSQGPVSQAVPVPGAAGGIEQLLTAHAIEHADRRFLGVMLVARNLAYLGQVQSTLRYSRKLASLNRLLAGVAHEVKNPLNAMTIHLELLKQKLSGGVAAFAAGGRQSRVSEAAAGGGAGAGAGGLGGGTGAGPLGGPGGTGGATLSGAGAGLFGAALAGDDAGVGGGGRGIGGGAGGGAERVLVEVPAVMKHVGVIGAEIRRLDEVVQGFLKFSRPEELNLEPTDLTVLVSEVAEVVDPQAVDAGVQVVVECPPDLPRISGDRPVLRQALLNLALNACQAMPNGGTLRFRGRPVADRRVSLTVEDTGVGIPPEHLPRIFDLYFTTREQGSGIGLSMVYRAIQLHDGSIEVQSTPGHGTVFTLTLPQA
jgi:signal transduction histidine kinase/HAMP domain-containing protein